MSDAIRRKIAAARARIRRLADLAATLERKPFDTGYRRWEEGCR